MAEEPNGGGHRRSARISALEEKARSLALERKAKAALIGDAYGNNFQAVPKRRGRKRKSLHDMEEELGNDENAWNQSLQEMPNKVVLEFILDLIMQRKDAKDVFAEPSDPDQENVKDSKDFGAIRAKIREGMYTSLAQFERDVNLITKNPMNFSSALSVFSSEDDFQASTISELADRLFSSLRTEPEKFPSEDSQTRNNGKKPLGEDGSSSVRNAKPKNGIHINNPSAKKRNYFASSSLTPNPSGSRQGGKSNFFDKRATYTPESFSNSKNDSLFSLELNEPKILELVPTSDSAYIKSFLSFLRGMGPMVNSFGSKKLTKTLNEASLLQQWNPSTHLTKTSDPKAQRFNNVGSVKPYTYLRGAHVGSSLQEPPYPRGGNVGSLPHNSILNPQGSYKGKAIAVDDGMNAFNTYGGGMSSVNSGLPWERPQANNGGSSNSLFLGEKDVDTSKNMSFGSHFNEQTTENDENTHLLLATLLQDNSPNMHTSSESSYLPPNGPDQFPNVLPSKIVMPSPSSTHKNYAGSMSFSIQSSNTPSPSSTPRNYAGSESMSFPILSSNIPSPSSTPNNYAGSMSFRIQSSNTTSPSSTPNNYAASMSSPIQSPNTTMPGIDTLYAKGKTPMIPATTPAGLEYYRHPQPSSSRNAAAMATPWYETMNAPPGFGFNFMNPFGEGSSNTPAFSLDRYGSKSSQDIQSSEPNRAASWGLQPTFDPPNLPAPQVVNQNPPPRYSFMQLLQGIPQEKDFLDETSFLEEADPPGHQALSNTQSFWNTPPSVPIDLELTEQPDLNLQL